MKYRVVIHQDLKYGETVIGTFDNWVVAQNYIETTMKHFIGVKVSIEVVTEEDEEVEA